MLLMSVPVQTYGQHPRQGANPDAHILSPSMSAMQHDVTFFGQFTDHTGATRPMSDS